MRMPRTPQKTSTKRIGYYQREVVHIHTLNSADSTVPEGSSNLDLHGSVGLPQTAVQVRPAVPFHKFFSLAVKHPVKVAWLDLLS